MKKMKKISAMVAFLTIISLFSYSNFNVQAAGGMTITSFDLNPKTITNLSATSQFQMTFRVTMDVAQFNTQCGSNTNTFSWYMYEDVTGLDLKRTSGTIPVNRTAATLNFNADQSVSIDTTGIATGGTGDYYVQVNCPGNINFQLARSADVHITFGSITNKSYACVAANNTYACSPLNQSNCGDVPASAGCPTSPGSCVQIGTNLCGTSAGNSGKYFCNSNNQCVLDPAGTYITITSCNNACGSSVIPPVIPPTDTKSYSFEITNPLCNPTTNACTNNIFDIINIVSMWILNISIPLAVLFILYAGFLMLTAGATPAKFDKGRQILKNVVLGLAVIFIGKGFISLIFSILNLGGPTGG